MSALPAPVVEVPPGFHDLPRPQQLAILRDLAARRRLEQAGEDVAVSAGRGRGDPAWELDAPEDRLLCAVLQLVRKKEKKKNALRR